MTKNHNTLKSLLLFALLIFAGTVFSQTTGILSGVVVDKKSNEALPGVNVTISGTVLGAATDGSGRFIVNNIPAGKYDLLVTMIGYHRFQYSGALIQPGQTTEMRIELEETVIETSEIVITASKRRQNIQDSPNSVGVLTQKDFQSRNEVYLDKILQYASGVNFVGTQVNIRGSSGFNYGAGSRVLLLVDGVPVMPGDSGDIKWDLVPTSQIERVEVIKGAGSALYGSSALGGVINIITKQSSARPVTNVRLSSGAYDRPIHPEWRWTPDLLYFSDVDVDHTRQIGKSEILLAAGRHQSTGYIQNTDYLRHNGSLKLTHRPNGSHSVTLSLNYEGGERQTSLMWRSQRQALEVNPEALGDYVESEKYMANLFHQWILRKNLRVQSRLSYFYNYWKNWYHDNITASTAQKPGYELQGEWQISQENALVFGSEGSWDHVVSGLVGAHDQYTLAGYAQNERKLLTNVNLTLGFRYDNQFVDSGYRDAKWSPKLGLVWHAQSNLTFRASSGRGFRVASMSERFPNGLYSGLTIVPNPGLKSETAWSHEIGVNLNPAANINLDVAGFMSDYWDMIEPKPNENQVIKFINVTRARISGVETTLKMQPLKPLSVSLGYTYMDPYDVALKTVLSYRPRHLFNAAVTYSFSKFDIGFDYRFVSRLERVEVYPNDERVDQNVLDLRASYNWRGLRLSLNANNIFNYNYTQMERTLMPIRHYVMSAALQM